MKEYQKPDVDYVSLLANEKITDDDVIIDGSTGVDDSIFG